MEADLVGFCRLETVALLRSDVHDRRAWLRKRATEGLEQGMQVVAGHRADVGDAEVLEQLAGLRELDHRPAEPLAELEHRAADERDPFDRPVVERSGSGARSATA